jgi:hypothetical protein
VEFGAELRNGQRAARDDVIQNRLPHRRRE